MPFKARRPAGGFRVMYEYANRLAGLGYEVHITYPLKTKFMKYRWPYLVRLLLSRIEGFSTDEWFNFSESITRSYVKEIAEEYIKESDVILTTWWSTAMDVGKLPLTKGRKINLIQGYEDWEGHVDLLHATYDMKDITNVVVASYLEKVVKEHTNKPVTLIPNCIDSKKFRIIDPIDKRNPKTVCMMYSLQEIKGSRYGIEALTIVKQSYPDLEVELFGICPEPEGLPSWIRFYRNPEDLPGLYNRNAIFISNSLTEGMALTPMEAMACGCASILTDIAGHSDYAQDNETALLYKAKDVKQLAGRITSLIEDESKRWMIAEKGNIFIQQFSWDNAVQKMDKLVKDLLKD